MNYNSTRYSIKIPDNIEVLNDQKTGYVLIKGRYCTKLFKSLFKIIFCSEKKKMFVTDKSFKKASNKEKKNLKSLRRTSVALLKNSISEVSSINYKKLNLIGVGYKVFGLSKNVLHFKLGFSHSLYFNAPDSLTINCLQSTKIFISGNDLKTVSQTAAFIKNFKKPEPYKGKGILYSTEKIKLKEGKKV